jgi:hypothetical protein
VALERGCHSLPLLKTLAEGILSGQLREADAGHAGSRAVALKAILTKRGRGIRDGIVSKDGYDRDKHQEKEIPTAIHTSVELFYRTRQPFK